jgi:hypothetical protein
LGSARARRISFTRSWFIPALDRSLRSRSNVIGLHAGPLSLFGVAEGSGPIAFAARGESEDRSLGSTAGGLSLQIARPDFHLEALASASYADAGVPALGWRPDYYASPALHAARGGEAFAEASLVAEKLREGGSALAAVSGSYGSLAGPALAFRLESREASGPLELRLRAAAANPAFHALFGKCERRLAGAAAEARLAMRRTSSISASVEAEAEGQGLRYAPLWGESAAFKLVLPLGIEADRFFESKLEARRPAEGGRDGSWAIAIKRGRSDEGGAADLDAALSWDAKVENLVVGLSTSLAAEGGVPSLGMELDLELFDQGSSAAPVLAKGGASVVVPWGRAGCLELDVDLPQAGIVLAPAIEGATAPPFSFRLRYKASFTASSALAR